MSEHPLVSRAETYLGLKEIPGKKHNPAILELWKWAGRKDIMDDETAWCSGFVSGCAAQEHLERPPVSELTMARSWLRVGVPVKIKDVQPGDVRVEARGPKPYGHVAIVKEVRKDGTVKTIDGNAGDQVKYCIKSLKGALGYRRLVAIGTDKPIIPTVKESPDLMMKLNNFLVAIATGIAFFIKSAQEAGLPLPLMLGLGLLGLSAFVAFWRSLKKKRRA